MTVSSRIPVKTITSTPDYQTTGETLAETITADELKQHLSIIASDNFEGRETATPGQQKAAKYLAEKVTSFGIPPIERAGVEDGYFQKMPFTKASWGKVSMSINGTAYRHLRDFYCFRRSNTHQPLFQQKEVVFLGYGIDDEKYSDYTGVEVKDKVVLVLDGEPTNKEGISYITGTTGISIWSRNIRKKLKTAKRKGVKAMLIIDPKLKINVNRYRKWLVEPAINMGKPKPEKTDLANSFFISSEIAKAIVGKKGKRIKKARKYITKKGKARSFNVACNISLEQEKLNEIIYSDNVMAYVEGTDEKLKEEIVVITAHYDHLGKRGDDIYNGADDNGTGTSALLELAQAYGKAKKEGTGPRRSVLLMWVSGEEKGLLGSKYYTQHPIFPLKNTIVNLNVDMIGRVDKAHKDNPNYIYVIGADRLSSELHDINEAANKKYTKIELDYTFNAKDDPNQFYYRSDHYNFAEKGIPAIFYFSGVHDDYHQTSDTTDKILFDKMEIIAKLIFHTSWELANRDKRIVVDKG